jgi:hypothetical protein
MDFKQNINKIDNELKKLFENVYFTEKADKGNFYVEITANKMFLFEGCKKRVEVKAQISKSELNKNIINWSYSLNPLNETSEKINKTSYLSGIANDIYDIAANRRMIKEYFNALEAHVDLINESLVEELVLDDKSKIANIISKYAEYEATQDQKSIVFSTNEAIKISDKFRLEKDLMDTGKVNWVSFDNNIIKVSLN